MIYSHSRLNTYENCPRKFAFQYIEKVKVESRDSIEAFMGSRVHDALEHLYKSVMMERTPKWEETRDFYEAEWDKNWHDNVLIVRKEYTAEDFRNVGRRCLQEYFVKNFPFADGRVLALEDRVLIDLDSTGNYMVRGFIDRLTEQDDGTIEIHDYKTSRHLPSQEEVDRDRQLALYQIGIEERWPETGSVRLVWHYLRSGRVLVSVRSRESLEQLKTETMRLIDRIREAGERNDFPTHESMLCDWCEYASLCPAKQHLFKTATMTPEEFNADDGVRLVDQFIAARDAAGKAKEELEEARRQLITFADQQHVERLQGHGFSVRVSRRVEKTVPPKKDPSRAALDAVLQASGRWVEVSDLSRAKLTQALQTDLFDEATRGRVNELLVEATIITVSARKTVRDDFDDGPEM